MHKEDRFPQAQLYNKEYVMKRAKWLEKTYKTSLRALSNYTLDIKNLKRNVENLIGCVQIPVGVAGPLKVKGEYAKGQFYIPLATTEKSLVSNYQLGMKIVSSGTGVHMMVLKNEMHISPLFIIDGIEKMQNFISWLEKHFASIKKIAESTTRHGKLLSITPRITGDGVVLIFKYSTKDAMGANMVNIATEDACNFIKKRTKAKKYYLRSNFSSDKKPSFYNLVEGYGKEIFAETIVTDKMLAPYNLTTHDVANYYNSIRSVSSYSYMVGMNAHVANLVAAIFTACGQDIAHVVNSSIGIATCRMIESDALYLTLDLPNLLVGTVGGGTALETQKECLELIGCYGNGRSLKFAEITCAAALAGELGIAVSLLQGIFTGTFRKLRTN